MEDYYRRIASEYEDVYHREDPVRLEELRKITCELKSIFKDRNILEIACGTGYWTRFLSETARNIVATDIVREMLEIAGKKQFKCPVSFCVEDAFNLSFKDGSFNGGLAMFWFSHIPRARISSFMKDLHRVLEEGSKVFMADNIYIPGIGGELVTIKGDVNTYKLRRLKDGSECLVLKNYFSADELVEVFSRYIRGFGRKNVFYGNCYWSITYELE